nr:hypothetical protein CFP56_38956 [Quercus suber]
MNNTSLMATIQITPADRIRDLNEINEDVARMIKAAGLAINALTGRSLDPLEAKENTKGAEGSEARKEAFRLNTEEYYTSLQSIIARLRRQAYSLEEAKIISPEAQTASSNQALGGKIINGGLGNLDVGHLNSRGNKVGAEKEAELIDEARKLLETSAGRAAG